MEGSKGSFIWHNAGNNNLRHNNDAEVQPVPRVPQEGEGPDAETPRQDFYQRLERVNASERVPGRKRERRDGQEVRLGRMEKKKPRKNPTQRSWAEQKRTQDTHGVQGRCEAHSQSSSPCMRHEWQSLLDELVVIKTRMGIKIQRVILTIRARDLQQRGWRMQHSEVQSWFIPIFIVLFLVSLSSVYLWVKSRLGLYHTSHHVWVFMIFHL